MEDITSDDEVFFLYISNLECGPQEINSREISLHFTLLANWKKRNKVCKNANSF